MKTKLFFFTILGLLLVSCSGKTPHAYQKSKALLDTFITITAVSDSEKTADAAIENAFARIEQFGKLINFYAPDSELALINKNAGVAATRVSSETLDVIARALYVAEKSQGAFDPTIGPVMQLWDFRQSVKPDDAEIRKKLPLVNYRKVRIDRKQSTVFLTAKGMALDLGGIAKGYAADLAVETLTRQGILSGLVAIAGDIRTFGNRPDGKPWNIGIRNPRMKGKKDEIIATLPLSGKAISTAGDYERFFISSGQRYHHIMNPATGYPAYGTRSVSVITDSGVIADGFDNAIFVLGPERGKKMIEELGKDFPVDAFILYDDGTTYTTSGIRGSLKHEKEH
ncbi:MAG: FAD:protein FMN transferase [Thermodesulfovibrio sp.]|nr:FAD:protein FMN transferase [Thermodesulfovibrio sp.]